MYLLSESCARLIHNTIESNKLHGIDIKDPSEPKLQDNIVSNNLFQVRMDKNAKKKWEKYKALNPEIIGANDMPQGIGCCMF